MASSQAQHIALLDQLQAEVDRVVCIPIICTPHTSYPSPS